jgi:hypothetical protein
MFNRDLLPMLRQRLAESRRLFVWASGLYSLFCNNDHDSFLGFPSLVQGWG